MKELKNGRSAAVKCDGLKLKDIIASKGFNPRDFAELLNYERSYFGKVFKKNVIGIRCVKLMEDKFGISPLSYGVISDDESARAISDLYAKAAIPKISTEEATIAPESPSIKDKILKKKEQRSANAEPIVVQLTVDPNQIKKIIKEAVMEAFEEL